MNQSPQSRSRSPRWHTAAALAILVLLPGLLFRGHLTGSTLFIGNSDRLNSHLKVLKYHVATLQAGHLDAWNDHEMLGYDSFALPYTFPNPLTYIAAAFGTERVYVVAGYFAVLLLALSGIAAYAFIRTITSSVFASVIGAVLYQLSEASVLAASQNDMSYVVFVLIPLGALLIRQTTRSTRAPAFLALSLLLFFLGHFTFLQYAAYASIFFAAYALFRSWNTRSVTTAAVFFTAATIGLTAAAPRIYGVGRAMLTEYTRTTPGVSLREFDEVYAFQNIRPHDALRWFDGAIFGTSPSDAVDRLDNNINLTEGFLLFTAPATPFIVIAGLFVYRNRRLGAFTEPTGDCAFLVWMLAAGFAVVVFKPALHLMYLLFLRIDFTHARFLIAVLLPLTAFVALVFADREPPDAAAAPVRLMAFGAGVAILLIVSIELAASATDRWWASVPVPLGSGPENLRTGSLARIALSLGAWGLLWHAIRPGNAARTTAVSCYYALGFWLALHTAYLADRRVNGTENRTTGAPFYRGNLYQAQPSEFTPPSEAQVSAFHRSVETPDYRAILLCGDRFASGFCAGHVPEFWQLRAVDGYYGLGVPTRLAPLPWEGGEHELRSIRFTPERPLSWPLLSLLNVKYAIHVDDYVYRNVGSPPAREALLVENPITPVPRAFFARFVSEVGTPRQAIAQLTARGRIGNPTVHSYAEGLAGAREFGVSGRIEVIGGGDRLEVLVSPSPSERFLVLNELFYPGWQAAIDGTTPALIYATNSFMRGIVVPANATSVELTFVPFVRTTAARVVYGVSVLLLIAGYWGWLRAMSRSEPKPVGPA